ncbi:MAG: DNA ligase D [Gemmatimonadaceae bacterium]|nr:DNA ligase D [Chitinophagaceae bacterium]
MSLSRYKEKRSFKKTPEPVSGKGTGKELRFVIQKHAASHLHYDFRLEMEGVLKSWAVPKGPSTDPDVKRLAMMVEDHPYDYRTFEGIIPKGNYGAGTVIVWDEGTYGPAESSAKSVREQEKELLSQLKKGKVKITLDGSKVKGEWALVKSHGREENAWLLMKMNDKHASQKDISLKDKSVISKKTIEQVAKAADKVWISNKTSDGKTKEQGEKTGAVSTGKKSAMPQKIKPMLATLVDAPFDGEDWIYEIKWDGYRAVGYLNNGKAELLSRNNLSFTEQFQSLADQLKEWDVNAVVDGEIVALDENDMVSFQQLQGFARNGKTAKLAYYIFDILWLNGRNLTSLPLRERKEILLSVLPENHDSIRYSDHIEKEGKAFFDLALDKGLEGIMAKKADSEYIIGARTTEWLKIKNNQQMEAIICGFTEPRKSRSHFGAVILGRYEKKELVYIGHSGSGFNEKGLSTLMAKFKPLITKECPFETIPKTNMPVTWLKPSLICDVKYTEWTKDKILRHPIFLGLREDKHAKNEKNIKMVHAPAGTKTKKAPAKAAAKKKTAAKKTAKSKASSSENLLDGESTEQTIKINSHPIKFTNLNKVYWPKEKITKRDMFNYYSRIAPFMLPYMKDRPQSLNRHPDGITGGNFYQKNVKDKVPDWIKTYDYESETGQDKEFLVCTNEASLLYIASLGCIEMNPWHSRVSKPDNPDWCVIDLDPGKNTFDQVIEAAQMVKKVLDEAGVDSYCKTSGSTGMHIYIPLGAKYSYDQSKMLAELVVTMVHHELPKFTSLERTVSKRHGKMYLDFLQNRTSQTIAAPYSLRPKPGATASAPLHWEEVTKGLKLKDFNIYNMYERVVSEGDLFRPVLGKGVDLEKALKKLTTLLPAD